MIVTKENFESLKELYEVHKNNPESVFIWEGQEVLTSYAKYMIEYLEGKLK